MVVNILNLFQSEFKLNFSDLKKGDSGGPMLILVNNRQYVVGIVSFGDYNCSLGLRYCNF